MICPITFVPMRGCAAASAQHEDYGSAQGLLFETFNGSGMKQLKARLACTLAVIVMVQEPRLDMTEVDEFSA